MDRGRPGSLFVLGIGFALSAPLLLLREAPLGPFFFRLLGGFAATATVAGTTLASAAGLAPVIGAALGVVSLRKGGGCAVADFDGDGFLDFYLLNFPADAAGVGATLYFQCAAVPGLSGSPVLSNAIAVTIQP